MGNHAASTACYLSVSLFRQAAIFLESQIPRWAHLRRIHMDCKTNTVDYRFISGSLKSQGLRIPFRLGRHLLRNSSSSDIHSMVVFGKDSSLGASISWRPTADCGMKNRTKKGFSSFILSSSAIRLSFTKLTLITLDM